MDSFYSLLKMKKYMKRIKKSNDVATLLGLDIGRIWVGTALSNKIITKANVLRTLELETGMRSKFYPMQSDLDRNEDFYDELNKLIKVHRVKGLIIGYPIKDNKPSQHALFVESLVKYMYKNKLLNVPCTFVNEAHSTFEAAHLLEMLQVEQQNYNPKFANNKKLKDQAAACVILNRFIEFYNAEEEEEISMNNKDETIKEDKNNEEKTDNNIFTSKQDEKNNLDEDDKEKSKDIFFNLTKKIASKKI